MLIKYIKSVLWRVAKCLSYIEEARCLKVKIQNRLSEPINVKNGVRQGDALARLLLNLTLGKVTRDAAVNTRATIFHKSFQILAYADGIDIIGKLSQQ